MPDRMSEDMPEDMPDRVPEDMPEHISEDMPGRMPEDMPEDMPDRMPEDMPDKMPEDMSDRTPGDLPVTKRIDVMVGITRSKVFGIFLDFPPSWDDDNDPHWPIGYLYQVVGSAHFGQRTYCTRSGP